MQTAEESTREEVVTIPTVLTPKILLILLNDEIEGGVTNAECDSCFRQSKGMVLWRPSREEMIRRHLCCEAHLRKRKSRAFGAGYDIVQL